MFILKYIYKSIKKCSNLLGIDIILRKSLKIDQNHEAVLPFATYAPWLNDNLFIKTYDIIRKYTLVDLYRCYELWQLVEQTKKLEGSLIEIGVWRGGSGALIAKKANLMGIKDKVYLCDTFSGVVKAGDKDTRYKGGEHSDTSIDIVNQVISTLNLDNLEILVGIFPDETGQYINSDEYFRFCHIDVDVYQSAKEIVEWIWERLVVGGVIVFDDYGFHGCDGITRFVDSERIKNDRLVIHNLNGHAILVKISK